MFDDIVVGREDAVREPVITQELPDVRCQQVCAHLADPCGVTGATQVEAAAWGWRQSLKTTVEQTLMRGLMTAFPLFVRGCLDLPAGVDQ